MSLIGLTYPLKLDSKGSLSISRGEELIRQQIVSVLETNPGERIMLPLYGMRDHILNSLAPSVVVSDIENVIQRFVPDAKNVEITFVKDYKKYEQGLLEVTISFQYLDKNISFKAEVSDG